MEVGVGVGIGIEIQIEIKKCVQDGIEIEK